MPQSSSLVLAFRLGACDLWHERHLAACRVLAMVAVLTPLLVLFGLKSGIIGSLTQRLLQDPANLEITIPGNLSLDADKLAAVRSLAGVGFVLPRTRSLAATLDLVAPHASLTAVEMVPSVEGDPLLQGTDASPPGSGQILLSRSAAQRLRLGRGDAVTGVVSRQMDGKTQAARVTLTVEGIVPEARFGRDGVFVSPDLLNVTEDYRDGTVDDLTAPKDGPRRYAGLRLFAADLNAVAPLADALRGQGYEVRTRAAEIAAVQSLDRVLTFLFGVIALLAVGGYALSLAAGLWADVDRKRKELGILRVLGASRRVALAFPVAQAVMLAAGGVGLGFALYALVAHLFNTVLVQGLAQGLSQGEWVCRLSFPHGIAAAGMTLAVAGAASVLGGYRAARIDPANSLREL